MIGNLMRISEAQLALYKETPELIEEKVFDEENYDADWFLDLDLSWEGVHYIITRRSLAESDDEPDVLARALFSCQYINEEQDLGFGPVNYLIPAQVKETNIELQKITNEEAKSRLDVKELIAKNVYPRNWTDPEAVEATLDAFVEVKQFYQAAADNNEVIVFFLS